MDPVSSPPTGRFEAETWSSLDLSEAARLSPHQVLERLGSSEAGLGAQQAFDRLHSCGPNAVRSHAASALRVFARQLDNPLLILLVAAAFVSLLTGQEIDASIILGILGLSVILGFANEYRSERAVAALHAQIRHEALVFREGRPRRVDVTTLVPGDVAALALGDVIPADLRLLEADRLECDEAVLTGESVPAAKDTAPCHGPSSAGLSCCAYMGTVVKSGRGRGVVVRTGSGTSFGAIAVGLGGRPPETAFQQGLRDFARLLVHITFALSATILALNLWVERPFLDSMLFVLAIAVGLTPELLPAIVTVSLAMGSRRLAERSVIVKRLVAIEDLGNIEVLFTDKTGTLTKGELAFLAAIDDHGRASARVLELGLVCHADVGEARRGLNPLDRALHEAHGADRLRRGWRTIAVAPFDYERRLVSALVEDPRGERLLVTKGAPEAVLERCHKPAANSRKVLESEFASGRRVLAVATRAAPHQPTVSPADEHDLALAGFLVFADPPKPSAAKALARLAKLGVAVKLVTGDNDLVSRKVCEDLGLAISGVLRGDEVEAMSDAQLAAAIPRTTIFSRMTPEQKSRVIRIERKLGRDVAFLGDGVNDAIALHDADVGISVDSGSEVAKDAADIVLLRKDLGVLAGGVVEGRRIFTNTIKYVLMGTSSNFGNMFSAAGASLFLPFLPMLPTQILLNNFLYDVSEMAIPTDRVDDELLERPARWDTAFIRRFMGFFGPISSVYDFLTFAILVNVFHADPTLFHSGWFVESLATQTLVIFIIRTRRVPFFRSAPSPSLAVTTGACLLAGVALPFSPAAGLLGFTPLPTRFLAILGLMVVTYLALAQAGVAYFFRPRGTRSLAAVRHKRERRVHRLASRWSLGARRKPGAA